MANRFFTPARVARLVEACCTTAFACACLVLVDLDHVPAYLWLVLWAMGKRVELNPFWLGRPLHIWYCVLGFAMGCGFITLFAGFSLAAYFLRRREAN